MNEQAKQGIPVSTEETFKLTQDLEQLRRGLDEAKELLAACSLALATVKLALDQVSEEDKQPVGPAAGQRPEGVIALPRKMDEDLYYIVGGAMGAQSPEQCGRADRLWDMLVARADSDALASTLKNEREFPLPSGGRDDSERTQ